MRMAKSISTINVPMQKNDMTVSAPGNGKCVTMSQCDPLLPMVWRYRMFVTWCYVMRLNFLPYTNYNKNMGICLIQLLWLTISKYSLFRSTSLLQLLLKTTEVLENQLRLSLILGFPMALQITQGLGCRISGSGFWRQPKTARYIGVWKWRMQTVET